LSKYPDLVPRFFSAVIGGLIIILSILWNEWGFFAVFLTISCMTMWEFYRLMRLQSFVPIRSLGVAIGGLVVYGIKYWPGVLLGIISGYMANHEANAFVFLVSTGITIESVIAAYLVRLYLHEHFTLDYMPELLSYLFISAVVVTLLGATWTCMTLMLIYNISLSEIGFVWINASLGKLTGAIVIAPFIIVWSQKAEYQEKWPKLVELICLMSILMFFGGIVFFGWFDTSIGGYSRYPLAYIFFPILTWAAF